MKRTLLITTCLTGMALAFAHADGPPPLPELPGSSDLSSQLPPLQLSPMPVATPTIDVSRENAIQFSRLKLATKTKRTDSGKPYELIDFTCTKGIFYNGTRNQFLTTCGSKPKCLWVGISQDYADSFDPAHAFLGNGVGHGVWVKSMFDSKFNNLTSLNCLDLNYIEVHRRQGTETGISTTSIPSKYITSWLACSCPKDEGSASANPQLQQAMDLCQDQKALGTVQFNNCVQYKLKEINICGQAMRTGQPLPYQCR
jgi:hypothetical protein